MSSHRLQTVLAVLIGVAMASWGQVLLKRGMAKVGFIGLDEGVARKMLGAVFRPEVVGGLALYAVSTIFYLFALSREDLSFVYPLIALNFVVVAVLSRYVLSESLNPVRLAGIVIVMIGVSLLATKG